MQVKTKFSHPASICWSVRFLDATTLLSCGSNNTLFKHALKTSPTTDNSPPSENMMQGANPDTATTIRNIATHPKHAYATCSFKGDITLVRNGSRTTLAGHENEVKSIAFSNHSAYLASAGRDKTVWIWDISNDLDNINNGMMGNAMNYSDDEGETAGGTAECIAVLQNHTQDVKCVIFSHDDCALVSCSYDDHINVYKMDGDEDWELYHRFVGGASTIWQVSFNADDSALVSACNDGSLGIWNTQDWSLLIRIELGETLVSCSWSAFEDCIVACGEEWIYLLRKSKDNQWACDQRVIGHGGRDVNCVEFSPFEARVFASSGDDEQIIHWVLT